jgi:SNF2 family DNA or RNA helicase
MVRDVSISSSPASGQFHVVQVEYLDGWAHPEAEEVLWEREVGARIISSFAIPRVADPPTSPDHPERLRTFLDAYRWSAVNRLSPHRDSDPDSVRLIAPWHSSVQIEDYQIYPVLKSLLMPRVSLLLADDVGLGKTIEAGLILSELFARRRIRRVLIVCPASLQLQWRDELSEKFHLDFTIVDREATFNMQRELGLNSNPWRTYPRIITSMDYLRQPDILGNFVAATQGVSSGNEAVLPWQLLIVDEAHNLFPSRFGDNSERYQMLNRISRYFEHRLFLTATPHNGYTVSFTGLLELLDPVRFKQTSIMDTQDHAQVQSVMIRRLKSELNEASGKDRFAHRTVTALPVTFNSAEEQLFNSLREYRRAALDLLAREGKRERHIGDFLLTLLTKRLLSSSYAFATTWWQHVEGAELGEFDQDAVGHAIERAEMPVNDDDEKELREVDVARQGGAWLSRYADDLRPEMDAVNESLESLGWSLDRIQSGLKTGAGLPPDGRWELLAQWIEDNLMQNSQLRSDERLIIFTEYKHTLDYLVLRLKKFGITEPQLEFIFGGPKATAVRRENIKEAFNDPESPLRILVATDTASEGINLQTSCRYVFHQEIPWNPMRLEQRNGRVDRHGQARDVYVFHFTSDNDADLRFMAHVVKKVERAKEDLGSVGQVIDQTILEHFTRKPVDEEFLDRLIDEVTRDNVDSRDIEKRDRGTQEDYAHSLQRLRATELAMGLSPESIARLLGHAMDIEKGSIEPASEDGAFRIRVVPPAWKKLVKESIEIRKGPQQGSLPKLVFDPAYFENYENGRKIYRQRTDTALIRLGHPLMRRALWTLRRQLWDPKDLSRWTVEAVRLPAGIEQVLVLHLMLEVTNELREVAHQEIIVAPFQVSGDHITPMLDDLWKELTHLERRPLEPVAVSAWVKNIVDQWISHEGQIREFIKDRRSVYEEEFEQRMATRLKEETASERERFRSRLKELQNEPRWLERQRKEFERQRQRLMQPLLFAEQQAVEEQKLRDIEWELMHNHIEQMKQLLERERQRMLDVVLPKRFTLASLDLQPLTVEYLVRDERRSN